MSVKRPDACLIGDEDTDVDTELTKTTYSLRLRRQLAGIVMALCLAATASAEAAKDAAQKPLDVKNLFRNVCGFCHEDYGRHTGKGPQLMNSERTDEFLFNRIKNGMPGRMAAWSSIYTDDQIRQMVKFIRNLKPGEEPQNP
jgi:mono/diheme cytochrome c family protein